MAYLKDKSILFVHIPKNAGKSVEVALGLSGDSALSGLGKRRLFNRAAMFLLRKTANADARHYLHGTLDLSLCAQHLTLQEMLLLDLLPRDVLSTAHSFAVCRNPFSRALSSFRHFRCAGSVDPTAFEKFCATWYDESPHDHNTLAHQRRQIDFIRDPSGAIGVERILRFESLADDFRQLCREWGVDAAELPHVGKQGAGSAAYHACYTPRAREIISERFADDISYFGYDF